MTMKETELRRVIREHIKRLLEAGPALGAGSTDITRGLSKIEKRATTLSPRQRVAAVIPVLQKFGIQPNDMSLLKVQLSKAEKQSVVQNASVEKEAEEKAAEEAAAKKAAEEKAAIEAAAKKAAPQPSTNDTTKKQEQYTAGVDDTHPKVSENLSALRDKGERLDKTQAFQMLQKSLAQKPANMQADFVIDLINKFNLNDSALRRLKMNIKNMS